MLYVRCELKGLEVDLILSRRGKQTQHDDSNE
jgi:hypothetical protein